MSESVTMRDREKEQLRDRGQESGKGSNIWREVTAGNRQENQL